MSKVSAGATMSIDGYIAGPDESGFDQLFKWYGNGDVEIPDQTGALVVGRHLFDVTRSAVQGVDVTHLRYTVRYA